MGRGTRDRPGHRGSEGVGGQGIRGIHDERWDPDQDPFQDVRDISEDSTDPAGRDYLWPENEEDED